MTDEKSWDALLWLCFAVGFWEGILPIVLTLTGRGYWGLAFPALLPSPWVWIVSGTVVVVAFALLVVLDRMKRERFGGRS
jgi:hypothetical protein